MSYITPHRCGTQKGTEAVSIRGGFFYFREGGVCSYDPKSHRCQPCIHLADCHSEHEAWPLAFRVHHPRPKMQPRVKPPWRKRGS